MGVVNGVYIHHSDMTIRMDDDTMIALQNYIHHGRDPGRFLGHVICNQLNESLFSADLRNYKLIPALSGYLYMEAPPDCWGDPDKFIAWMAKFKKQREEERERLAAL